MKQFTIIMIAAGYLLGVVLSFVALTRIEDDLKQRCPSLMDRRWKRILWLLSCLLFIPLFLILLFVLDIVKEFISGDGPKQRQE